MNDGKQNNKRKTKKMWEETNMEFITWKKWQNDVLENASINSVGIKATAASKTDIKTTLEPYLNGELTPFPFKPILPQKKIALYRSGLYSPSYQTQTDTSEPQNKDQKSATAVHKKVSAWKFWRRFPKLAYV